MAGGADVRADDEAVGAGVARAGSAPRPLSTRTDDAAPAVDATEGAGTTGAVCTADAAGGRFAGGLLAETTAATKPPTIANAPAAMATHAKAGSPLRLGGGVGGGAACGGGCETLLC